MKLNKFNTRAQGSFEYMASYGWAVLIAIVVGIALFSLGVFSPQQSNTASGFRYLTPISWEITPNDQNSANISIVLQNDIGKTVVIYLNDTKIKQSIRFQKPDSLPCYFNYSYGGPITIDNVGNQMQIVNNKTTVPQNAIITIRGTIDGYGNGTSNSKCGGIINQFYRYNVYIYSTDEYLVERIDYGEIRGLYR